MAEGLKAGDRVWLFVWSSPQGERPEDGHPHGTVVGVEGRGFGRRALVRWDQESSLGGQFFDLKTSDLAREGEDYEGLGGERDRD